MLQNDYYKAMVIIIRYQSLKIITELLMKRRLSGLNTILCFILSILLMSCDNKPKVYVYAKYLSEQQKQSIAEKFEVYSYNVTFNDYDFPTSMTDNTILYSPFLQSNSVIDNASEVTSAIGMPIYNVQGLTEGNHWYTNNSIGVFLFPENRTSMETVFSQDLVGDYEAQNCGHVESLVLSADESFVVKSVTNSVDKDTELVGTWAYRQFPYLEFSRKGESYSSYYFEIEKYKEYDGISEVEFIKLISLNDGVLNEGCVFLVGRRL